MFQRVSYVWQAYSTRFPQVRQEVAEPMHEHYVEEALTSVRATLPQILMPILNGIFLRSYCTYCTRGCAISKVILIEIKLAHFAHELQLTNQNDLMVVTCFVRALR